MTKIRCQDCGRTINANADWAPNTCKECGGDFAEVGSDDDTYEADSSDDSEEGEDEYEDTLICSVCRVSGLVKGKDIVETGDEDDDGDSIDICNKCLNKYFKTKVEYVDKIVEKPVYVDKEGKQTTTIFQENMKSKFD